MLNGNEIKSDLLKVKEDQKDKIEIIESEKDTKFFKEKNDTYTNNNEIITIKYKVNNEM